MGPGAYRKRIVDGELAARLRATGAVVIEGPKACGKTATARQLAASEVLLDVDDNARLLADVDPARLLEGPTPRLIDEWQLEPSLWNRLRRTIDERGAPGQFILTGSAVPADEVTRHTGAGRLTRLRMRTMSLFETGSSTGEASVASLLAGEAVRSGDPGLAVSEIAEAICRGGWPGLAGLDLDDGLRGVRDYLDEIRRVDVGRVGETRHDPTKVGQLIRSLARNAATYAAATTLARDSGDEDGPLKSDTARAYMEALRRLMIVEDQPAWAPHLRSKYVLRAGPKRHFVDPSLAAAALRANPDALLRDLRLFGFLFESLVVRDLRVYAQAADAEVLQYRDSGGLEVDAILQAADGRWAALEVKLGTGQIDDAATNLLRFARQVDTQRSGKPQALAVIVSSGFGYVRKDGVAVIPIGALGP